MKYVLSFIKKFFLITLILVGVLIGIVMSFVIGGMGLALMGTAIGIGPVGWVGLGTVAAMASYGFFVAVRSFTRSIRRIA